MTRRINQLLLYSAIGVSVLVPAFAQAPASSTLGNVLKVDTAARQIVLKTDSGAELTLTAAANASFRRVAPGETDLRNASTIALTDIAAGDRILARGKTSDDQKSVAATLIVVMSKSDIANKQAGERADWDKRGVSGNVTATAPDQITINARGQGGPKPLTIVLTKDAVVRRYAPDSVKFSDATVAKIGDIKVGDQVRARGDKSEDGTKMTADEVVAGTFKTIAATINSIDTAQGTLKVTNLDGKKPMTVKINSSSVLHKLPPQMAQQLAARNRPAEDAPARTAPIGPPNGPPGGFAGRGGRGGGDLTQVIDRTPKVELAELKQGDAIIVSSTVGASADQVTAITLVAGVEPILTAPGRKDLALGEWSLGVDLGGGAP